VPGCASGPVSPCSPSRPYSRPSNSRDPPIGSATQRLARLRRFAALLAERGALRPGLSADRAADIIWTVCAQANYDSLVTARGWTPAEYRDWLAETLANGLLADS